MKNKVDIHHEGHLVASIIKLKNLEEGLSFFTNDNSYIQFGTWNYKKGKVLDAHFHNTFDRNSTQTQEAVVILKGKVECKLYDMNKNLISSHILKKNSVMLQYKFIHEYKILKNSIVLEFKNGPYFGPEVDRKRVNVYEV